jgi:hypothetical protein
MNQVWMASSWSRGPIQDSNEDQDCCHARVMDHGIEPIEPGPVQRNSHT